MRYEGEKKGLRVSARKNRKVLRIWMLDKTGDSLTQEVVVAGGGFVVVGELCEPCSDDGHALFSFQKLEVASQPQSFGTILAKDPQQGREQLGSFVDFDDGIGHAIEGSPDYCRIH